MTGSKNMNDTARLLTETELELMNILWVVDGGTVRDVMERLSEGRDLAYTSVSTILRILEQKGYLRTEKEGRGHRYLPNVDKQSYEARSLRHMINTVFDGTPSNLVRRLVDSGEITESDYNSIAKLMEEGRKDNEPC